MIKNMLPNLQKINKIMV